MEAYTDYSKTYVSNSDIGRTKLDKPLNSYFKKENSKQSLLFKVGDKIKHEKYGSGTVIKVEKSGSKSMMVDFDDVGIKLFDLNKEKRVKKS